MATENLIVKLDADNSKLNEGLDDSKGKLSDFDKETTKTDTSLKNLSKGAGIAGAAIEVVGTAATVAAAAITTIAVASAKSYRELELLASQTKMTTDEFQAFTFATEQYNISAEQAADISKDLADKLGEFATAGTGAFQDFIDVMGLTKEEGKALSQEFQDMSSDQVIGKMVSMMEDADASANQMTFALESMGNDLSRLIPLFADNSKELDTLTGSYKKLNAELALTDGQAAQLSELSASFDLMVGTASNATTAISTTLAPTLSEFFNSVIQVVPDATNTIIDFINTFNEAGDIQSIKQIDAQMEALADTIENGVAKGYDEMSRNMQENPLDFIRVGEYQDAVQRLNELEEQRTKLLEEQAEKELALKEIRAGGDISGSGSGGGTSGAVDAELQALEDRYKTEEELLLQKLEKELQIAGNNNALKMELENTYIEDLALLKQEKEAEADQLSFEMWKERLEETNQEKFDLEIEAQQQLLDQKLINEEAYLKEVNKIGLKYGKIEVKEKKKEAKTKEDSEWDYAHSAIDAAGAIFSNNKAVSSTLAFINTAEGVTAALAKYDYVGAAIIAATGATQIAAINSASVGSTGSVSAPSEPSPVVEEAVETGTLEVSATTSNADNVSNTQTVTHRFEIDSDDPIMNSIVDSLNDGLKNGQYEVSV